MAQLSVEEYLNSNPLTDEQTSDFLKFVGSDDVLIGQFQEVAVISARDDDAKDTDELDRLGLEITNAILKYARRNKIPSYAMGFLRRAAEQEFSSV